MHARKSGLLNPGRSRRQDHCIAQSDHLAARGKCLRESQRRPDRAKRIIRINGEVMLSNLIGGVSSSPPTCVPQSAFPNPRSLSSDLTANRNRQLKRQEREIGSRIIAFSSSDRPATCPWSNEPELYITITYPTAPGTPPAHHPLTLPDILNLWSPPYFESDRSGVSRLFLSSFHR